MRHLRPALYKDLKLFFSGAGLLSLALPLLLLPALLFGMGDLSGSAFLKPFPIAVHDEDQTLMSASLISQIRHVELFSEVMVLDDTVPDSDAIAQGAAAVVTIPKDFFYDLYLMEECPVAVTLNSGMPLEASLFEAVLESVMEIIRSDHAAGQGVYQYCYGTPTSQQLGEMYEQTGMTLVKDALGRQQVFSEPAAISDLIGALAQRLCATVLFILACYFSLAAVRTLPEETTLGVIPRLQAAGGSRFAFLLSKYLTALLLTLPTFAAICLLLPDQSILKLLVLHGMLLFAAFGLQLALAAWTQNPSAVQRLGNLFLLSNLVLGGTLWPRQMLPAPLFSLSRITLPYYGLLGMEAIHHEVSILSLIWPLPVMGGLGIGLSCVGFRYRRSFPGTDGAGAEAEMNRLRPSACRMVGMGAVKCRGMMGSSTGCAILMAALLLCGIAANTAGTGADSLRLAVCDLDRSSASEKLVHRLQETEGLAVTTVSAAQGQRSLMLGENEGLLTIGEGYETQLNKGKSLPLAYESASGTISGQGGREVIAGQVMAQKARARAVDQAEEILGRRLTQTDKANLMAVIDRCADAAPSLYHVSTLDGGTISDPFVPDQMAYCVLAILFVLLTAAPWCGGMDARAAAIRLRSLPHGRVLSLGSDCLALLSMGLITGVCTLLPAGWDACLRRLPVLLASSFCCSTLALLLTRFSVLEGRVDGVAPVIALVLCLLGGCFLDFSQLSTTMKVLALLTPTGLTMAAADGTFGACGALVVMGGALLAGCVPHKRSTT